jgi:hypothetical protein
MQRYDLSGVQFMQVSFYDLPLLLSDISPCLVEYIKRINENKTLQKCTFSIKVKHYIINAK